MDILRRVGHIRRIMSSKGVRGVSYFIEDAPDLEEAKKQVGDYKGGSVRLELNGETGIATLTLDNPGKKNALSGCMMVELAAAITRLEMWERGRGVILRGNPDGASFCSGADLTFVRKHASPKLGFTMATLMTDTLARLSKLPMVSCAYIDGSGALGGGGEIASWVDYRLMTPSAKFGLVHTRMGIVPAWGGSYRLCRLIGRTQALLLAQSGRTVGPEEIPGLIQATVPDFDAAVTWLSDATAGPLPAIRAAKAQITESDSDIQLQARIFAPLFGANENQDALSKNIKFSNKVS